MFLSTRLNGPRFTIVALSQVIACSGNDTKLAASFDSEPTIAGTLPGTVSVGKSGDAAYQIPLDVAPGSGGLRPVLSVDYNSGSGNGILGVGFSLGGLSAVRRSGSVKAIDGKTTAIAFNTDDQFLLDGQRLMNIDGKHQQDTATYRTRRESFTRVVYRTGDTGDYFVAHRKDGSIMEYGRTPDSRLERNGKVWSWAVNKISDRNGNYMVFTYAREDAAATHFSQLVQNIKYTGNAKTGLAPYNTVEFHYEDRTDPSFQFFGGAEVREDKRLSKVVMRYHDGKDSGEYLWEYRFRYETALASGHSRLAEVRKFGVGADGTAATESLPGTMFEWPAGEPLEDRALAVVHGEPASIPGNTVLGSGDFDGDGTLDLAVYSGAFTQPQQPDSAFSILYAREGRFVEERVTLPYQVPTIPWNEGVLIDDDGRPGIYVADFDGDGRSDVVSVSHNLGFTLNPACDCPKEEEGRFTTDELIVNMYPGGVGTPIRQAFPFDEFFGQDYHMNNVRKFTFRVKAVSDLTGDGRAEIVFGRLDSITGMLRPGAANGVFALDIIARPSGDQTWHVPSGDAADILVRGDMNGDGADDLITRRRRTDFATDAYVRQAYLSTTLWFARMRPDGTAEFASGGPGLAPIEWGSIQTDGDFNDDGLTDFLVATVSPQGVPLAGPAWVQLAAGNGNFRLKEITWPADGHIAFSGDFNGDGLTDFVTSNSDEPRFRTNSVFHMQLAIGDGTFRSVPLSLALATKFGPDAKLGVIAQTDLDGDELTEFVIAAVGEKGQYVGTNLLSVEIGARERDRVAAVTNGLGKRTEIDYALLSDDGVYTKGTGAAYPTTDLVVPMTVVRSVREIGGAVKKDDDTIAQGVREKRYTYAGARQNLAGYGFLGFRKVEVFDVQANTTTRRAFEQNNLEALGMQTSEKFLAGADLVRSIENQIGVMKLAGDNTTFPYYTKSIERKYNLGGGESGGAAYFVSTVTNMKPDGTSGFDSFGNITHTEVETMARGKTRKQVTSSVIANDTAAWLLGRVSESTTLFVGGEGPNISRKVKYTYHPGTGQVWRETGHDGIVTEHLYDEYGNETKTNVVNYPKAGDVTLMSERVYDDKGRAATSIFNALRHETRHTEFHYGIGAPTLTSDVNGLETSFTYDAFGALRSSVAKSPNDTDADRVTSTRNYTSATLPADWPAPPSGTAVISVKKNTKQPTAVVYRDVLGRELRTATQAQGEKWVYVDQAYDVQGRVVEKSLPYFSTDTPIFTTSSYDALGRPEKVIRADGVEMHYKHTSTQVTETRDALGEVPRVQTTIHNGDGDVVQVIDPAGQKLSLIRDAVGQIIRTEVGEGANVTPLTSIVYDAGGRKKRLWDSNAGRKSFRYDTLGRKILTVTWTDKFADVNGKGEATLLELDLLGRTTARTTGSGTFNSAAASRAGATAFTFDAGTTTRNNFVYDEDRVGTLTRSSNGSVRRLYFYDDLGRRKGEALQMGTISASPVFADKLTLTTGTDLRRTIVYDAWGRAVEDSYAQKLPTPITLGSIHHQYDDLGFVTKVESKHPSAAARALIADNFVYDASGRLRQTTYGNGVVNKMGYEELTGRMKTSTAGPATAPNAVENQRFVYDAQGNLKERFRGFTGADGLDGYLETFTYDVLDRLKTTKSHQTLGTASTQFWDEAVTYDRLGNIRTRTSGANAANRTRNTYHYDSPRLHAVTRRTTDTLNAAGAATSGFDTVYGYDNRGQVTSRGGNAVTWTRFGRPLSIAAGDHKATFAYDAHGSRVRQAVATDQTISRVKLYFNSAFEAKQSPDGALVSASLFATGPAGALAVVQVNPAANTATPQYFHKDHLGSIVSVTNQAAAVVQRLQFDAWGLARNAVRDPGWQALIQQTGTGFVGDRGFTGHEMLSELGLVHMNARVYDPRLGRFLSPDGYVQSPTNLQNYNRYSYVLNQPLSLTDPSGNFFFIPAIIAIAKAALAVTLKAALYLATHPGVLMKAWSTYSFGKQVVDGDWKGALRGVAFAMITKGLTMGVGVAAKSLIEKASGFIGRSVVVLGQAAAHGVVRGGLAEAQGGKFKDGAIAGATASLIDSAIGGVQTKMNLDPTEFRPAENIAVGLATGTVSELTGSKFMSGFATGTSINRYNKTGPTVTKADRATKSLGAGRKLADAIAEPTSENVAGAGGAMLLIIDDVAGERLQIVTAPINAGLVIAGDQSTESVVSSLMIMAGSQIVLGAKLAGVAARATSLATPAGLLVQIGLAAPDAVRGGAALGGLVIERYKALDTNLAAPTDYEIQQAYQARAAGLGQ